jgi:hypothetical protein
MEKWLYRALLVAAFLFCLALAFLITAFAYRVMADTETCSCIEAPEGNL